MNDYIIRPERKEDYSAVEHLVRESFWNVYRPGCSEHYVIHVLRDDPAFVKELDFVMEKDGQLIGQNMFMKTVILSDSGSAVVVTDRGGYMGGADTVKRHIPGCGDEAKMSLPGFFLRFLHCLLYRLSVQPISQFTGVQRFRPAAAECGLLGSLGAAIKNPATAFCVGQPFGILCCCIHAEKQVQNAGCPAAEAVNIPETAGMDFRSTGFDHAFRKLLRPGEVS